MAPERGPADEGPTCALDAELPSLWVIAVGVAVVEGCNGGMTRQGRIWEGEALSRVSNLLLGPI